MAVLPGDKLVSDAAPKVRLRFLDLRSVWVRGSTIGTWLLTITPMSDFMGRSPGGLPSSEGLSRTSGGPFIVSEPHCSKTLRPTVSAYRFLKICREVFGMEVRYKPPCVLA